MKGNSTYFHIRIFGLPDFVLQAGIAPKGTAKGLALGPR
jgi:hypothetical protein